MEYTGLELFMDNLGQLSYSEINPLINDNPSFISHRPRIIRLYEELRSLIQIMFVDKHNLDQTAQVRNLKTRLKDVAQEAHSIVGLFLYSLNHRKTCFSKYDFIKEFLSCNNGKKSIKSRFSMNLENVMTAINTIKEELKMIPDHLIKMDLSPTAIEPLTTTDQTIRSSPLGRKKVSEEMVVGVELEAGLIRDKLAEDQMQLDVVSIVGMGGLGKTTLATKVFNDAFVVYHFPVRAWVTVSQKYERRDLLIQVLASMDVQLDFSRASDSQLRENVHKRLMGKRYLIVIDDIWSTDAWDDLRRFFPNNHNGSRILLTSRIKEVALHAKPHGFVHQLKYLTDEESWELLSTKVFGGYTCPRRLFEPGMQIAKHCQGLPLAIVVMAGVLAKIDRTTDSWERVGQRVSSYIVSDGNGCRDILALSYDHLPPHLKDCFLYLGGFPEDHKFRVRKLIWLWIAEGFIQQDVGNQSLEEIAEHYLLELVDRNLVTVADRKSNGAVKFCYIHDLLREFCYKTNQDLVSQYNYKPHRIFKYTEYHTINKQPRTRVQSVLCCIPMISSFPLLMVLDLQNRYDIFTSYTLPQGFELLVHLRYLAFGTEFVFPSSICKLLSLRTLIVRCLSRFYLPNTISNLVNLRHLWSDGYICFPSITKPMNLQIISNVALGSVGDESWYKCFPCIKKLTCTTRKRKNQDFESLSSLETLMWMNIGGQFRKMDVMFPASLRKLSLSGCGFPWSDMSIIQSLPNLEVLSLLLNSFLGPRWELGEVEFRQLRFLKLHGLNIREWEASSINFPCLTHLVLDTCRHLEAIPLEIGDISTLELIDVDDSSLCLESLSEIHASQQYFGNSYFKIKVRKELSRMDYYRKLRGLVWMLDEPKSQPHIEYDHGCF